MDRGGVALGRQVLPPSYQQIYGLNATNPDGTPREKVLRQCTIGERLKLVLDAECAGRSGLKVCRASGELLGYLTGPIAEDVAYRKKNGLPVTAEIVEFWYQGLFKRVHRRGDESASQDTGSRGMENYLQRIGCFVRIRRYALI